MRLLLPLCAALCAVPASAGDFAAVNIGPTPDALHRFDTSSPAGASFLHPLSGNFIRGIELSGPDDGWYVASAPSGSTPTGFFWLDDGVSTLVAAVPFTTTSVGGMSFSFGEDFLWIVLDPPTGDDTLYRIDFDGTWSAGTPLAYASGAAISIGGLALDPSTGVLYAIDNGNDSLVTVDPLTGALTIVGALGVSWSGVGGLDFDENGVLYAGLFTTIHTIDLATGAASASLGTLPFTTSSIAAIPSPATLDATVPFRGQSISFQHSRGGAGHLFAQFLSPGATYLPLGATGTVRIDFGLAQLLDSGALDASGNATRSFAVPNQPELRGQSVYFQSLTLDPLSGATRFTNPIGRVVF
ncbi:MAG: DUF4394 domain-containing protein [Planctomycetes bacterium]|nr:DUF4394 domain-containing protein [Planctomycetota bacterium]